MPDLLIILTSGMELLGSRQGQLLNPGELIDNP